jgi:hypothetical protein
VSPSSLTVATVIYALGREKMAKITLPEHGDGVVVRGASIPHDTNGRPRENAKEERVKKICDRLHDALLSIDKRYFRDKLTEEMPGLGE